MHRFLAFVIALVLPVSVFAAASTMPISRYDAFQYVWNSLHRAIDKTSEKPYTDVSKDDPMYKAITFAKSRNILGDFDTFRPKDPLTLDVALIWLFRSRNLADPEDITPDTLSGFLVTYPIAMLPSPDVEMPTVTEDQLLFMMRSLDEQLSTDIREMSLYSEKFNGKGTAFGETFDMYAMSAAHKFFPYNTLVKVTNVDNDKSVTVRVNDRGPYVKGRDMDLSLGAFTTIADRSKGVIHATMQRLGDANIVGPCVAPQVLYQRITKSVILNPGLPHIVHFGTAITLASSKSFVIRSIQYPDGFVSSMQNWILPGENFTMTPSVIGEYTFKLSSADGHNREMTMQVVQCSDSAQSSESAQ